MIRFTRMGALVAMGISVWISAARAASPARMVVLTDIEAEADDTESMVRLMLYSDVIDLQGLIATTSCWKRTSVAPDSIRAIVRAYGRAREHLVQNDPDFPPEAALESVIGEGLPIYGMAGVGAGKDSDGSNRIIRALGQNDDRPLWVTVWGGINTLAQALYTLRATRSPAELDQLVAKLRVYAISDQDDAGPWIRKNFPKLFYIVSPGGDYSTATWSAINGVFPGIDNSLISNAWLAEHIQQGHGPLGAAYLDVAWGMEGDTPSWLNLIPNGLSQPEHPNWGGWGGRYELSTPSVSVSDPKTFVAGAPITPETRPIWTNADDTYNPPVRSEFGRTIRPGKATYHGNKVSIWRWREDFQNDFAARMEWATKPFAGCNHPPVVVLGHPNAFTVHSGETFELSARGSSDPDGDSLTYYWFCYPEAGTYPGGVAVSPAENLPAVFVTAPKVASPETLHYIVRVTDKGTPPLSRYQRVIVTVIP